MKFKLFTILIIMMTMYAQDNPLLKPFTLPFNAPPINEIKPEHFKPAYLEALKQHNQDIENIINNVEEPNFKNTIEALENAGQLLSRVSSVFGLFQSVIATPEILKLANEITPLTSKHYNEIALNDKLFEKIKKVYDKKASLNLSVQQNKVLDNYNRNYVRNGILLDEAKKKRIKEINQELSMLSLKFNENVLKESNAAKIVITKKEDLKGLPESVISAASEAAEKNGHSGEWIFTIDKPSMLPFLQYADNRNLREKLYKLYINVGDNNNEFDNKEIVKKTALLKLERAKLFGAKNFAEYQLEITMAKKPEAVFDLLEKLWTPALEMAKKESAMMQEIIAKEGNAFKLESWDWWYYAEKIRKEKYNLDENEVREYLSVDNVLDGVFYLSNKLFGLTFKERKDIPVYHEDVKVFEVIDFDSKSLGILYTDYFPRQTKRSGAWCSAIVKQKYDGDIKLPAVVTNNGNFTKPTKDKPALLNFDEVSTLFHEFGHALHQLLSDIKYPSISGTSVPRDFVELPSQIMENWVMEPEVLNYYAKHYKTGEVIPQSLVDKIQAAGNFNKGFQTTEYLAASILDMKYHTIENEFPESIDVFEKNILDEIGLIPEIISRYRSTYFKHIFSGGYSAGYYSYIWAEVLDSDAFEAFKETSIFDQKTAKAFREYVLSKGGSEEPMELYKKFRGREPKVEPLLKKRGML
jgi:peptidyl-dipeptidase Dcp